MKSKLPIHIVRLLVGSVFIFSGFVKLVDPIGSQYKFEEYFSRDVLNLEFLIPYALTFSILLIIIEIMLGIMLLIGFKPKFTVRGLLGLITLFSFLTWYSAYYNKVTDCGCFGDAVILTNWQTFYKNIILIVLILFLFFRHKYINAIFSKKITSSVALLFLLSFGYITYHVLEHLPIIDFRAYAIGKNISEGMTYKGDGKIPAVHDFSLENEDTDLTKTLLVKDKVMLVIVYDLSIANKDGFSAVKKVADKALTKGYTVYGVSASFKDDLVLAQNKYDLPFSFLFCDATTLKTMIRANPGIMILHKGTVAGKWNWTDAAAVQL